MSNTPTTEPDVEEPVDPETETPDTQADPEVDE